MTYNLKYHSEAHYFPPLRLGMWLDKGTMNYYPHPNQDKAASTCGRVMAGIWAEFGAPGILQMDNGTEFMGEMQEVAEQWSPGHLKIIHGR